MNNKKSNVQLNKLFDNVEYAFKNSPFYKEFLKESWPIIKEDFSIDSFRGLPFTTKNQLSINNDSFLSIAKNKIAEYVNTSGTTGNPVNVFLSKNDISLSLIHISRAHET